MTYMRPKIKPLGRTKILYGVTKSVWGGAQRYVFDLATNLPAADFEVAVVCGSGGRLVNRLEEAGIRVYSLPRADRDIKIWSDCLTFVSLFRLFSKEKPAIVHLNSPKIAGLGVVAARLARVPKIIFTEHGWAFNEDRPVWQKKLIAFFHWLTVILCHKVITVSRAEREQVKHWPWVQSKFVTIHNGITPVNFLYRETSRDELTTREAKLLPHRRELWIVTIGELHRNKDYINAIGAIALLKRSYPDIRYLIIGDGEQRVLLENLVTELNLTDTVFFLGTIPEAYKYLRAFDIFLLNSRKEGFPYVVLEAGLAGLPVIATTVGGLPEIIKNDQTGVLVPPGNPEATAKALADLAANGLEREILGRNLESVVRSDFSCQQMVKETTALYN